MATSKNTYACGIVPTKKTRLYCNDDIIVVAFNICNSLLTRIVGAKAPPDVAVKKLGNLNHFGTCVLTARHSNGEITATTRRQGLQDCVMIGSYIIDIGVESVNCYDVKISTRVSVDVARLDFTWGNISDVANSDNVVLLCDDTYMAGVTFNDNVPSRAWVAQHGVTATRCIGVGDQCAVFAYKDDIVVFNLPSHSPLSLPFDEWLPASSSELNSYNANIFRSNSALAIQYGCNCGVAVLHSGDTQYTLHESLFAPINCMVYRDDTVLLQRRDKQWFRSLPNGDFESVVMPAGIDGADSVVCANSNNVVVILDSKGTLRIYCLL